MGRWKEAVSRAQRARKKRYCRRMGWVERRFVGGRVDDDDAGGEVEGEEKVALLVLLVVAVRLDEKGGGGARGSAGEDEGVAFSMRAQVR